MQDTYQVLYGNSSSLHQAGRRASQAVDDTRATMVNGLGANSLNEIIFTSSGSEADNLALIGVSDAYKDRGNHINTTRIEYHAVLHPCEFLERAGFEISYLPVNEDVLIHPDDLNKAIRPETILSSIIHANNEIVMIQPIADLAEIAHKNDVLFHTDTVYSIGQIPVNVSVLGVDLLTLSAHKFYGPKGVGAHYVKEGIDIAPLIHGGIQETGRRAGTENVPGIVGTAKAIEIALKELTNEAIRLTDLRDQFWNRLSENIPDIRLNGHPSQRLPNNLNGCYKNVEAEGLLMHLNAKGIQASMGSDCSSESIELSHVIKALGIPPEWERGALRFSLGKQTTLDEISKAADIVLSIVRDV